MTAPTRGTKLSHDTVRAAGRLRAGGASFDGIALELGLVSRKSAHWAVRRAVTEGFVRREDLPAPHKPASRTRLAIDMPYRSRRPYIAPEQPRNWRDDAACAGTDPELFFAPGDNWASPAGRAQAAEARAVCEACPALAWCRAEAIAAEDDWSFRGGLTPEERRVMRQNRSVA